MDNYQTTPPQRQQVFGFAKSDLWQHLPVVTRRTCEASLAQLLLQVFSHDGRDEDERED
jgi:hypothetical protein